jgi:hypothetical protein
MKYFRKSVGEEDAFLAKGNIPPRKSNSTRFMSLNAKLQLLSISLFKMLVHFWAWRESRCEREVTDKCLHAVL